MSDQVDDFYDLCELFEDDMELVLIAIKELAGAKEKPSILKMWIEALNTKRLSVYVDRIMLMELHKIKLWKISKLHRQLTFYDFIGEDL